MNREDISHLATLSRIALTEEELSKLEGELSSIVSYVAVISDLASDTTDSAPEVGPLHNVFRPDTVTNDVGQHTNALLAEMPQTEGAFLKVKKILGGTQ
jgi:aspartyl-tRNA(Asn)/glutamyl-tRNA(Gln) amidotransferase subunit C